MLTGRGAVSSRLSGHALLRHRRCPLEVEGIIRECVQGQPLPRPTMQNIVERLQRLIDPDSYKDQFEDFKPVAEVKYSELRELTESSTESMLASS